MFYDYICSDCKYRFEVSKSIIDELNEFCPKCGNIAVKEVALGCSFILKGSGFYHTEHTIKENEARRKARENVTLPLEADPNMKEIKKIGKEVIAMKRLKESSNRIESELGSEVHKYTKVNKPDRSAQREKLEKVYKEVKQEVDNG